MNFCTMFLVFLYSATTNVFLLLSRLSSSTGSHFSMLGIGDIVMPGLLLCFVLRYDNYKKQANGEVPGPGRMQRVSYFHCTLIGYFVGKQADRWADYIKGQGFYCFSCLGAIISGIFFCLSRFASTFVLIYYDINDDVNACSGLLTATVASRIHRAAQPALLYLVPFTLLPLLTMAYLKVHRRDETNLSSHLLATDKSSALAVFARVSSLLKN